MTTSTSMRERQQEEQRRQRQRHHHAQEGQRQRRHGQHDHGHGHGRPQHYQYPHESQQQQQHELHPPQTQPQHYLLTTPPAKSSRSRSRNMAASCSSPTPAAVAATPPSTNSKHLLLSPSHSYDKDDGAHSPAVVATTPPSSSKKHLLLSPSHSYDQDDQQSQKEGHEHVNEDEELLVEETEFVDYSRGSRDIIGNGTVPSTLTYNQPDHSHHNHNGHLQQGYSRIKALATMEAATPPADNRMGQKRIRKSRHLKPPPQPKQPQVVIHTPRPDDEADSHHVDDETDSIHSDLFAGASAGEWTLESYMDHQLHASYLHHETGFKGKSKSLSRKKRLGLRRGLSLNSAHSNGPDSSPDSSPGAGVDSSNDENGNTTVAASVGRITKPLGSTSTDVVHSPRKRRVLSKVLLSLCTAILVICGWPFLLSFSDSTGIIFRVKDDRTADRVIKEGSSSSGEHQRNLQDASSDSWHPLFPHSERTADVEVEVPQQHKKDPNHNAGGSSAEPGGSNGASSSNTSERQRHGLSFPFSKRTLQDKAMGGGGEPQTPRRTQEEEQDSTTSFIQGEVVQDLCPATHTLISQSLILRSSYGNIFSITTPDQPNLKKRNGSGGGSGTGSGSGGRIFSREKKSYYAEDPSEAGANAASAADDNDRRGERVHDAKAKKTNGNSDHVFQRKLQTDADGDAGAGDSYADTGDYNDIDTATESIYDGTGVETITIKTLSLRMSDYRPNEETHFEVWLYTGSGDNVELNSNDLDDDPTNDNTLQPSKGEYQGSRAKFTDWVLISEGKEKDLVPDTDFFDHNGHIFNIGSGTTIGPLGRLDGYENMEDVTLAAQDWNEQKLNADGGMDAITTKGEITTTYFFKIPEEKFMPLKLPKYDGKLTLFVTLDRVGLQYGYAAKQEFDITDVTKHDYIDQTPSLDVLNGNVNLRMSVGEGVIFYPWMEEEFFYQTRRFLGKIWYDAQIPCEYVPVTEVLDLDDTASTTAPVVSPTRVPTVEPTIDVTTVPSVAPSENGTYVAADLLISVLIKDGPIPPMPDDVKEIFENTLLDFVDDQLGDFCPLTWNEGAKVVDQDLSPIGGLPSGDTSNERKRNSKVGGDNGGSKRDAQQSDNDGDGIFVRRFLRKVLEPILYPEKKARHRLLNAITLLDVGTVVDALYNSNKCPNKTPEEWANLIETYINDNSEEFLDKLKAAHEYFRDAFGVSADAVDGPPVVVKAAAIETEEEGTNWAVVIGGIMAALLLCCFCCCLPLLVVRRRKRKESKENEIIGEDIEWARPVDEDHYPPLGGFRGDSETLEGDGAGDSEDGSKLRKRPDGEWEEESETPPDIGLEPIPPGIRPPEDDTEMLHSTKWLDREEPDKDKKKRLFGMPGRMPVEGEEEEPSNINIYPGGDYEEDQGEDDSHKLRHVEKEEVEVPEEDWKPDHYEPDGGLHSYDRPVKPSPDINASWNRLPQKEEKVPSPPKKLSIKQLVLQRKKELEKKKQALRQVEMIEKGDAPPEEDQLFPKPKPDSRIEDLMSRIKDLEKDRTEKYQKPAQNIEESDYERWRRLNIADKEISSDEESSDEEIVLRKVEKKKKRKKKKEGGDYMLNFDDLDAYNKALAVHQDAYIHKWVKVKVEKGDEDEDEGANLEDIEMETNANPKKEEEEDGFIDDSGDVKDKGTLDEGTVDEDTGTGGGVAANGKERPDTRMDGNDDDSKAAIKDEIVALVGEVLPEQLGDVGDLLKQFEGREESLLNTLRAKAKKMEVESNIDEEDSGA